MSGAPTLGISVQLSQALVWVNVRCLGIRFVSKRLTRLENWLVACFDWAAPSVTSILDELELSLRHCSSESTTHEERFSPVTCACLIESGRFPQAKAAMQDVVIQRKFLLICISLGFILETVVCQNRETVTSGRWPMADRRRSST